MPDKNLKEIEDAPKLANDDKVTELVTWEFTTYRDKYKRVYDIIVEMLGGKNIFTEDEIKGHLNNYVPNRTMFGISDYDCLNLFYFISKDVLGEPLICDGIKHTEDRSGYFIAAPKEHFDLTELTANADNKGFYKRTSVVYKDPIVFRYVKGGIQVISKWGLEGNDEAL